jgi:hypothetical protein
VPGVIIELREYEVSGGKMPELHERFRDQTVKNFARHGFRPLFFAVPEIGGLSDTVVYALVFEDLAQREEAWKAFHSDPEWIQYKTTEDPGGVPVVRRFKSTILKATDYSPTM